MIPFARFLIKLDDIDNQSASTIARQYDKNGARTIGIHSNFVGPDLRCPYKGRHCGGWRVRNLAQDPQRKFSPPQSWVLRDSFTFTKGDGPKLGAGAPERAQFFPIQRSMVSCGQEPQRNGEVDGGSQCEAISNDWKNV